MLKLVLYLSFEPSQLEITEYPQCNLSSLDALKQSQIWLKLMINNNWISIH